jgi:VWFA-related protein
MRRDFCGIWVALLMAASLFSFGMMCSSVAGEAKKKNPAKESTATQEQESTPEPFKFKVAVDLVTTDVTVIGNPAAELQAEDFTILDNGTTQQVSHFSQDQIPLAIALLVDTSLSVQQYLPILQIAGGSALRHLNADDQVALYSITMKPKRENDLTLDQVQIAKEIGKLQCNYGTDIYWALDDAAHYLFDKAPNRRRAIILISDNCHWGDSFHTAKSARNKALETATTIYGIKTPGDFMDNSQFCGNGRSGGDIKQIAEDSGGEVIDIRTWTSLPEALSKAILNLRKQYTLGFNPSGSGQKGSYHELSVKFSAENRCPGCRLLSRAGYYEGVSAPLPSPEKQRPAPKRSEEKTEQLLIQQSIYTAGTYPVDMTDIPISIATTPLTDANGGQQMKVDVQIDSRRIQFKTVDGQHACKLHITVFGVNSGGKILNSDWRILEGKLKEETYLQAVKSGLAYPITVSVKPETQYLKVVIYDEESDRAGSKSYMLAPQNP